ncbi:hypothetical protein NBRC116583_26290 [Arenicella sp. 4NH20-0111]|uniref:endonuclease/exonuclease/phosphatase family protein n=1 Tax=Arenicella sp. 4NH20-0111 TaxID=3127648 RepID=UPI003101EE41
MVSIREIQGDSLNSPYAGQPVVTRGVVTGIVRKGFFIQTPNKEWDGKGSDAIFVYSPDYTTTVGADVEVSGTCVDFLKDDDAKPVTQIHLESLKVNRLSGEKITPIEFTSELLKVTNLTLSLTLNSMEGMLMTIKSGSTFIAPSNAYGDYVLALPEQLQEADVITTDDGGVIVEGSNPLRWFPGFRVTRYDFARRVNLGSTLRTSVTGPLNYRVGAYQMAVSQDFEFDQNYVDITKSNLVPESDSITVMTLNCFNLDPHVESEKSVTNPRQDVDDDWGEGRFHTLAQAVALQANVPDIVALQEIQDNDGAELTEITAANETYELLIKTIEQLSGVEYHWVDVNPELGMDGGQPGGNIRNGFLYNPNRIELLAHSTRVLGKDNASYEDSRKPLVCEFIEKGTDNHLTIINVHLASKRHQSSIFSPSNPGVDGKLSVRTEQARVILEETIRIGQRGQDYYVTGDFNDGENSEPLRILVGESSHNLVFDLDPQERYDYNHRGKLQVLMHGVVSKEMHVKDRAEYEIIHGNELIGIEPGTETDKPSDHAYVIAKISF